VNIMSEFTFSCYGYNEDSQEMKDIVESLDLIFSGLAACDVVNVYPWLRFFPFKGITNLKKGLKLRDRIYRKQYEEHMKTYNPENIRDILDSIIKV